MPALPCLLCLLLLAGAGCRKRPAPVASAPAPAAEPAKEVPVEAALHHLNTAVRNYSAEKLKLPASLDEVYAAGYLKERFTPPPGKQFVINPKTQAVEVR